MTTVFPTSPADGDTYTANGIEYTYSSTTNSWGLPSVRNTQSLILDLSEHVQHDITANGNLKIDGISTINSSTSNLTITGGTAGQALFTSGNGVIYFANIAATAGGTDGQIQFSNSGLLAGNANLTWSGTVLTVAPDTAATSSTTGSIKVTGGVGVSGNIYVGTNANVTGTANISGNLIVGGNANVTGTANIVGNASFANITVTNGITSLQEVFEKVNVDSSTVLTGNINVDLLSGGIYYYTANASGNFGLNFRGNSSTTLNSLMANGQAISVAMLTTQGTSAYYAANLQVDGSVKTVKWSQGTAPSSGNASSIDMYAITLIKTGTNTFTVIASQNKFA